MPRLLLDSKCFLEIARGGTAQGVWFDNRTRAADYDGAFVSSISLSQLEMSLARAVNNGGVLGARFRALAGSFATNDLVVPYEHAHHDRFAALASLPLAVRAADGTPQNMSTFERMVVAVALAGQLARPFVLVTPQLESAHRDLQTSGLIIEEAK